jgi:hypothetical protein
MSLQLQSVRCDVDLNHPRAREFLWRIPQQVGTWLSLVERTLGVGEVASSNLVVPTILP